MEQEELQDVMKYLMTPFNNEQVVITDDTIMNEVISPDDGFPGARSEQIYPLLVKWTIHENGGTVKPWPEDWLTKSVKELATAIIMLIFILFSPALMAQSKALTVNLGAVKTDNRANALAFNFSYLPNLSYSVAEKIKYGKHSVFSVSPNFEIYTGSEDAFSSITGKITGLDVIFQTTKLRIEGHSPEITVPDVKKVIHSLPFSAGFETNSRFNFINALVEAGYVPWYQGATSSAVLKRTKIGVFVQAGYKFKVDTTGKLNTGGQEDQSEESLNTALFRVKASASIDTKALVNIQFLKLGLAGDGQVWFDFINATTYFRLMGALRVYVTQDNYVDLMFQRGSGAPNFNEGDQWGIGLTISF